MKTTSAEDKTAEPAVNAEQTSTNSINPPNLDERGQPTSKAISSFKQAHSIAKTIVDTAREGRIKTAAIVMAKYNAESPYKESDLKNAGQDWRNNFSTNWLGSIIDRVVPQLKGPLQTATTLTYSALPDYYENADEKSKVFQGEITATIRSWPNWMNFIASLCQEDTLHGSAAPGRLDDDWRPTMFRFDEVYLPEGSGQHASQVQIIIFEQKMLLHEFIKKLKDPDAAEAAGFKLADCVRAANRAAGKGETTNDPTPLELESRVREGGGNFGEGYDPNRQKTVDMWHVCVLEYDGGVACWTVEQENGWGLRQQDRMQASMEDTTTLFTLQTGNEKFYGSKGLGRMLANIHIAVERLRCVAADQLYLAGLLVLEGDESDANKFVPEVRHPFVVVGNGYKVATTQIQFDPTAFEVMDNKLNSIGESIAGAFIPPNIDNQGSSNTKIEAAQKAERELAVRQGVSGRFQNQLADLVGMMQRAICSPDTIKESIRIFEAKQAAKQKGIRMIPAKVFEWIKGVMKNVGMLAPEPISPLADRQAVECIVRMLEQGLSAEEIAYLANQPASDGSIINSEQRDQATVAFAQQSKGNPYYDQKQVNQLEAELVIGKDRATRILLPEQEDPNIEAVATRQQIVEFGEMMAGEAMPVAQTDKHSIHRKVLAERMLPMIQAIQQAPTPEQTASLKLCIQHHQQHLAMDRETPPEHIQMEAQQLEQISAMVDQVDKMMQQAAAKAQAQQQQGIAQGAVPISNGQPGMIPPSASPERAQIEDPSHDLNQFKTGAEMTLRAKELDQKDRQLSLEESKHDHAVVMDQMKAAQDQAQLVQQEAKDTRDHALKEAATEQRAVAGPGGGV